MKRTEAPKPVPVPPTDDRLVEVEAWVRGVSTAQHFGLAIAEAPPDFCVSPPTLYIETSIVSYATARPSRDILAARMQMITRHWWHEHRARHVCFISELVRREALRGDPDAADRRSELLLNIAYVHPNAQSHELAARILAQCRLPSRAYEDAHHAAMAALNGLQVLLTWNCKHLANAHMIPFIRRACEAYGCAAPVIHTPEQLIGVCAYGRSGS